MDIISLFSSFSGVPTAVSCDRLYAYVLTLQGILYLLGLADPPPEG